MICRTIFASAVVALGLAGGALAATAGSDPGELKALGMAAVSAADAVAKVESKSGAKVVELTLIDRNGSPAYQVSTLAADGSELTFLVDGSSGAVTQSADAQDTAQAGGATDADESGESASDADSGNEDAD